MPVYLAESRQEAFREARKGAAMWLTEYFHETLGQPLPDAPPERIIEEMVDRGVWIVGSPDDCIARMEQLEEQSGGFGGLLVTVAEWTSREKMLHSYELLARYVAPHFQGSLTGLERSRDWSRDNVEYLDDLRKGSIKKARSDYQERVGEAARI
jgi:limonene 1,2-monooxygenase